VQAVTLADAVRTWLRNRFRETSYADPRNGLRGTAKPVARAAARILIAFDTSSWNTAAAAQASSTALGPDARAAAAANPDDLDPETERMYQGPLGCCMCRLPAEVVCCGCGRPICTFHTVEVAMGATRDHELVLAACADCAGTPSTLLER
jgi:hypothetical protein